MDSRWIALGALALAAWAVGRTEVLALRVRKVERDMSQAADAIKLIDKATNEIAAKVDNEVAQVDAVQARVTELQAKLADLQARGEPPSQAELDLLGSVATTLGGVSAKLDGVSTHLVTIGADPNNPAPPAPEPPAPAVP